MGMYYTILYFKLKHGGEKCRVANKQMARKGFETPRMSCYLIVIVP